MNNADRTHRSQNQNGTVEVLITLPQLLIIYSANNYTTLCGSDGNAAPGGGIDRKHSESKHFQMTSIRVTFAIAQCPLSGLDVL